MSVIRLHEETRRDGTDQTKTVPIYREKPFMVTIKSSPLVTEVHVAEARMIETVGGFAVRLTFERRGSWLLEQYTTANKGKRIAIFAQFSNPADRKDPISRWLGAPKIFQPITDGVLSFTPDCDRSEASELVLGLNRLSKKLETEKEYKRYKDNKF